MDNLNINNAFYFVICSIGLFFWFLEIRLNGRHKAGLGRYRQIIDLVNNKEIAMSSVKPDVAILLSRHFVIDVDDVIRRNKFGLFKLLTPVHSVLPPPPASPYRLAPALLTSIGVLGTFLGISMSLYGLNLEGASSATLMTSAFKLLGGMKTAFYTSLAGMLASVVFMIILFWCGKARERRQRQLQGVLSKECMEVSPVSVLMGMSPDSNAELQQRQLEMADAVIKSSASTSEVAQDMKQLLQELDADKLAKALSDAVRDSVKSEITPALQALPDSLQELKEIKQDNGEKLVSVITTAMRNEVIAPVMEDLRSVSQDMKDSGSSTRELITELHKLTKELGNTTTTLNTFQQDTLTKLTTFAESLKEILDQFKADTNGVLKDISAEINHSLAAAIQGMKDQRAAFEDSAEAAKAAFEGQNEALGRIGSEAAKLMQDANNTLQTGLGDIDGKIREVSTVVQQELESFRTEYQQNLTGFFEQQETLLDETLGRQREGLAGVVADYRKAFEEENVLRAKQYEAIKVQYDQLQQGVGLVQQLVEAVGLNKATAFDQLQDVAKSVSSQVALIRKEYGQAAQKFSDMTEQLPKAMNDYYQRAEASHGEFFESFDAAAAKVHSRLAEAAGLLVTAMQTIELQKQALLESETR